MAIELTTTAAERIRSFVERDGGIGLRLGVKKTGCSGWAYTVDLAREVLELHTLGVGAGYRQEDISQFAELLTGLSFDRTEGEMTFRRNWAEPGSETVLGRTYGGERAELGDIYLALDDLADHPATARHVCWKLARHFLSDEPPEDVVASMRDAFTATRPEADFTRVATSDHHGTCFNIANGTIARH